MGGWAIEDVADPLCSTQSKHLHQLTINTINTINNNIVVVIIIIE